MKKFTTIILALILGMSAFAQQTPISDRASLPEPPAGYVNGLFTVNEGGTQVYFSQGDLLGWGTSSYDHEAVCYQPCSTSESYSDYYAYGSETYYLNDQTGKADWGYNAISNGGNMENPWFALNHEQWVYVFNTCTTTSGIRYAKATVNNVKGVILLPDNWDASYYTLSNTNTANANYSSNTISETEWATLEQHGAVFLPAAGARYVASVIDAGAYGGYWSSCHDSSFGYAGGIDFGASTFAVMYNFHYFGQSVRLVRHVV